MSSKEYRLKMDQLLDRAEGERDAWLALFNTLQSAVDTHQLMKHEGGASYESHTGDEIDEQLWDVNNKLVIAASKLPEPEVTKGPFG